MNMYGFEERDLISMESGLNPIWKYRFGCLDELELYLLLNGSGAFSEEIWGVLILGVMCGPHVSLTFSGPLV